MVEDNPAVRLLLTRHLERAGFEVDPVDSGETALGLLAAGGGYETFLVDMTLPGISGLELAREIFGRFPAAKVLLISGDPFDPAQLDPGNPRLGFLRKPFQPSDLAAALQRLGS